MIAKYMGLTHEPFIYGKEYNIKVIIMNSPGSKSRLGETIFGKNIPVISVSLEEETGMINYSSMNEYKREWREING